MTTLVISPCSPDSQRGATFPQPPAQQDLSLPCPSARLQASLSRPRCPQTIAGSRRADGILWLVEPKQLERPVFAGPATPSLLKPLSCPQQPRREPFASDRGNPELR